MSKIFVTGSKGFVGRHLVPALEQLGHRVFTDQIYWNQKFDCIIHLAAVTHINNVFDPKLIESNFILTNKVFEREERIIYASSCSARHFTNPYAMSKLWSEYLGKKHGNALGLRFFNIYGEGNNKGIIKYLMGQPDGARIKIRGPELIRDYIYVKNIVAEIIDSIPYRIKKNVCRGKACMKLEVPNIGAKDVGTGVGLQTMDVVNLYQRLSGKQFIIDVEEAGDNEPKEMVSNFAVPYAISLEGGLTKMINNQTHG